MQIKREVVQMALDILVADSSEMSPDMYDQEWSDAITALREALVQPEPEPVAWRTTLGITSVKDVADKMKADGIQVLPLYPAPPAPEHGKETK